MKYIVRLASPADEAFLWQMLYYAAHMDEEGVPAESAKTNPDLSCYVENWGQRPHDLGFVALSSDGISVGATWIRVMPPESQLYRIVTPDTPELAVAIAPAHVGRGAGTLLLEQLLEAARGQHHAIALSVRANNRARTLYERLGFVVLKKITNRVGTVSFLMEIELG